MKRIIITSVFLISTALVFAQTDTTDYYSPSKNKFFIKEKVSTSVSMGTSIGFSSSSKNPFVTTFIAPKIGYQITPKLKMNLGLMHYTITGNTFTPISQNEALYNSGNKTANGNLIFIEGQYQIKPRLILSAAVMTDIKNTSPNQNDYKAASFGLEYKVTKHSSIKFETTLSNKGNYLNQQNMFPGATNNSFGTGFYGGNSVFR